MLAVVARIAKAVKLPVTADVEAGYGPRPEDAARTARDVLAAGAVGMNLEDATGDPKHPLLDLALQVERVKAVKELPIVLNARTDVYLLEVGTPEKRYDEALRRLAAFRDAGADCVFVPGLRDPAIIGRLVKDLQCPVNILAGPGSPSVPELQKLGVARVSVGSAAMRATLGLLRRIAEELNSAGTYTTLEGGIPFRRRKPHDGMITWRSMGELHKLSERHCASRKKGSKHRHDRMEGHSSRDGLPLAMRPHGSYERNVVRGKI